MPINSYNRPRSVSITNKVEGSTLVFYLNENPSVKQVINYGPNTNVTYDNLLKKINSFPDFDKDVISFLFNKIDGTILNTVDEIMRAKQVVCSFTALYSNKMFNGRLNEVVDSSEAKQDLKGISLKYFNSEVISEFKKRKYTFFIESVGRENINEISGEEIYYKTFEETLKYIEEKGICKRPFEIVDLRKKEIKNMKEILKSPCAFILKPKGGRERKKIEILARTKSFTVEFSLKSTSKLKSLYTRYIYDNKVKLKIPEDFNIYEKIGTGSFSIVYRACDKDTNEIVAIKTISKEYLRSQEDALYNEVNIHSSLSHNFITSFITWSFFDNGLMIVTEYAKHGDLFGAIYSNGSIEEEYTAKVIHQIGLATVYLHSLSIIHRDIKVENILIFELSSKNIKVKLTDFGISVQEKEYNKQIKRCGTPNYIAPEIYSGRGYNSKVDIYSIGIVAFMCLCSYCPFQIDETQSKDDLRRQITSGRYIYNKEAWKNVSQAAKDFVFRLINVDPMKRPFAIGISSNVWIKNNLVNYTSRSKLE